MKLKSNDPLQALLREALHKQKIQVKDERFSKNYKRPDPDSIYKPSAWKPGRELVLIIHVAVDGTRTTIGLFQEQINQRAHGSRLIPVAPEVRAQTLELSALPRIEVHEDYWVQPALPPVHQDSPQEIRALRERFQELLESFK